jgi:hypothetical protein
VSRRRQLTKHHEEMRNRARERKREIEKLQEARKTRRSSVKSGEVDGDLIQTPGGAFISVVSHRNVMARGGLRSEAAQPSCASGRPRHIAPRQNLGAEPVRTEHEDGEEAEAAEEKSIIVATKERVPVTMSVLPTPETTSDSKMLDDSRLEFDAMGASTGVFDDAGSMAESFWSKVEAEAEAEMVQRSNAVSRILDDRETGSATTGENPAVLQELRAARAENARMHGRIRQLEEELAIAKARGTELKQRS